MKKPTARTILWVMVILYAVYFSVFTVLRIKGLYSHYFDLGIMHQAVYNTYQAIRGLDFSRILEIANPHGPGFMKRMAVHNDIILGLLAPFYFIYSGPQTLVVFQTLVLAAGAFAVFGIAETVFKKQPRGSLMALAFSFAYLMYTPMQRANIFDFHAVTLATTFLLFMFYFALIKRYRLSFLFLILSLFSKEEVGLTTSFYALYLLFEWFRSGKKGKPVFPVVVLLTSALWFLLSMLVIIPYFRGGTDHFALNYYSDFGDSPLKVILGVIDNPAGLSKYIWHIDTLKYFWFTLGPVALLSLFSPLQLIIAAPEFGINLLSNNWNMRNIIYHYTSVIQPFIFIASIYGAYRLTRMRKLPFRSRMGIILPVLICASALFFSYFKGPLPYSQEKDTYALNNPTAGAAFVKKWAGRLKNESISVSTTGHLAPFFSSRRNYSHFPNGYEGADYVIIQVDEVYNYFDPSVNMKGLYEALVKDPHYTLADRQSGIEVYKKINQ